MKAFTIINGFSRYLHGPLKWQKESLGKDLSALSVPCLNRLIHESRKRRKMEVNHMYNGRLLSFLALVLLSCGIISRTLPVSVHVAKL